MRYTPNLQIPIPETLDEVVPLEDWFGQLAEAIDAQFDDTGWMDLGLLPGFSGRVQYRLVGVTAEIRFDISGEASGNVELTQPLPESVRPVNGPGVYSISAYVNTSPANQFAQVYLDTSAGVLRVVGAVSRVRGGDVWFIG